MTCHCGDPECCGCWWSEEEQRQMDNEKSEVVKMKPGTSLRNWVCERFPDCSVPVPEIHPSVLGVLQFFEYEHLPPPLQAISKPIGQVAYEMAFTLPNNPELTKALDKLREAKDRFVTTFLYVDPKDIIPPVNP